MLAFPTFSPQGSKLTPARMPGPGTQIFQGQVKINILQLLAQVGRLAKTRRASRALEPTFQFTGMGSSRDHSHRISEHYIDYFHSVPHKLLKRKRCYYTTWHCQSHSFTMEACSLYIPASSHYIFPTYIHSAMLHKFKATCRKKAHITHMHRLG